MDLDALVYDRLGWHGTPFHIRVLKLFADSDAWHVLHKEFPVADDVRSSSIDIVAKSHNGVNVVVECKRVDPKSKSWVFVRDRKYGSRDLSYRPGSRNGSVVFFDAAFPNQGSSTSFRGERVFVESYAVKNGSPLRCFDSHWVGYSFPWDLSKPVEERDIGRKQIEQTPVSLALNQVVAQCRRYACSELSRLLKKKLLGVEGPEFFIPVIVTSCSLFSVDLDPNLIDDSGSALPIEGGVEPREWLVADIQSCDPLLLDAETFGFGNGGVDFTGIDKNSVFVVNVNYLPSFLDILWRSVHHKFYP